MPRGYAQSARPVLDEYGFNPDGLWQVPNVAYESRNAAAAEAGRSTMLTEEMVRSIEGDRRRDIDAGLRRHQWLPSRRAAPRVPRWVRAAAALAGSALGG